METVGRRQDNGSTTPDLRHWPCRWRTLGKLAALFFAMSVQGSLCPGLTSSAGQKDLDEPSRSHVIEIPFTLYNNHLIIVKGNIGPIKGVNLILDTGTTPTSISKSIAGRLKLQGNTEPLHTVSGVIQTQSVRLPHIQVGEMSANNLRVVTQDLGFVEESLGISVGGVLGLDVLMTQNFTIDYRRKKISFGVTAPAKNLVHFETQAPLLTVKANVEGQELRLIVDSGTSGLMVFRSRIKTPAALRPVQGTFVTAVAGIRQAKFFRTLVTLGKDTSEHVVTIAEADPGPENEFDGLLGFTGMGFQRVSFDFGDGTFGWE